MDSAWPIFDDFASDAQKSYEVFFIGCATRPQGLISDKIGENVPVCMYKYKKLLPNPPIQ